MKLPFFKPRQERVRLQAAELAETREPLRNPARGWYQIHTFLVDREPDLEELTWCLNPEDALVLLLFDIGGYRDRNLDQEALGRMARVLEFFARRNYDCVVRAVYDHEGRAPEREPFFFAQVLAHLEQVAGVLKPFSCVFVYQGMLVGSWGEMHSSRFLSRERLGKMAEVLQNCRGEETWLAVRRPVQWRQLHKEGPDPPGFTHMTTACLALRITWVPLAQRAGPTPPGTAPGAGRTSWIFWTTSAGRRPTAARPFGAGRSPWRPGMCWRFCAKRGSPI